MNLSSYSFDQMLPSYLTSTAKGRIKDALDQFFGDKEKIEYHGFYTNVYHGFLMQSDILHSAIAIDWNIETSQYDTGYTPAILISNSCDVSTENDRTINNKEAILAPLIAVDTYLKISEQKGYTKEQRDTFYSVLQKQEHTNLFYLPRNDINGKDYIVRFDKMHWYPKLN